MEDDTKIFPQRAKVLKKQKIRLGCFSYGDTKWYYKTTTSEPISSINTITFEDAELRNGGDYYCYGLYPNKQKHFLAKRTLKVYGKHKCNSFIRS